MTGDITMAEAITALVAKKRAFGYTYAAEGRVLARFAAFCRSQFPGLRAPTQASVEAWVATAWRRGVTPATLQGLAVPVRESARWLGRRGVPAYVLPAGALPRPARYVPHIYTDQELVAALFAATDRCRYCSLVTCRGLAVDEGRDRVPLVCRWPGGAAQSWPLSWWRAVWSVRSRPPACAGSWRSARSNPGGTSPGSSCVIPTSPRRPPWCWTCMPGSSPGSSSAR
jgi:hypothetical protein